MNSLSSPLLEVITVVFHDIPYFILSAVWTTVYTCFYVLTSPFRLLFYLLWNYPFIFLVFPVTFFIFVLLIVAFLKRRTVYSVLRSLWQAVSPYTWTLAYSALVYLFPPIGAAVAGIKLALTPVLGLFNFISALCRQLGLLQNSSKGLRQKNQSGMLCDLSEFDTYRLATRMLCCVCLKKEKSVLLEPCRHVCLCSECAIDLNKKEIPRCPMCHFIVKYQHEVFI